MLLLAVIVWAADRRPLPVLNSTDYMCAFYVAGHMVNHGAGKDLYPQPPAANFYQEKFALYARRLLNEKEGSGMYLFAYPPLVALVAAPFARLEPAQSLMAWQAVSFLSLLMSSILFASTAGVRASPLVVLLSSCLFFPLHNVIVVGQTPLLIGLLPLAAGYFFWQRQKPFLSGVCWSVLGLKPQLAIPIVVLWCALAISALACRKRPEDHEAPNAVRLAEPAAIAGGVVVGLLVEHGIPLLLIGTDSFGLWLNAVKMSSQAFAAPEAGYWQYHLFFSLPNLLVLVAPKGWWQGARLPSYVVGALMLVLGVTACCRILGLPMSLERRRDLLMILAVSFMIFSAPHILLYDTCLLLLPAWILFFKLDGDSFFLTLGRAIALAILAGFDLYICLLLSAQELPAVAWQLLPVAGLMLCTFLLFFKAGRPKEAT